MVEPVSTAIIGSSLGSALGSGAAAGGAAGAAGAGAAGAAAGTGTLAKLMSLLKGAGKSGLFSKLMSGGSGGLPGLGGLGNLFGGGISREEVEEMQRKQQIMNLLIAKSTNQQPSGGFQQLNLSSNRGM
jgi:hypothetical protein